ncbi:MAG: class I SAM-dependent methyltransferase [Dehalococcoidia bacterium]
MDPVLGTMTPASDMDDASYLDFVEGIRAFNLGQVQPVVAERYQAAARAFAARTGRPPAGLAEAHAVLDSIPVFQARNRIWRSGQEMMWQGVVETYRKREAELLAELDAADRRGPGSVGYDASFAYPAYFDAYDAHIQPGSYHRDPLAGYIYHYGTKIFSTGSNNRDDNQRGQVRNSALPADGQVRRILDLACSIGQSATAWQEQFPQAEVWAIDIAAPMVRYAHKRAAEMGLPIHFRQMLAEELAFPDASFDLVHAYILFHEIPVNIIRKTLREAARVLRPGGVFVIWDFGRSYYKDGTPYHEAMLEFVTIDNGEPFAQDFCHLDFPAEIRAAGFRTVEETDFGILTMTVGTR